MWLFKAYLRVEALNYTPGRNADKANIQNPCWRKNHWLNKINKKLKSLQQMHAFKLLIDTNNTKEHYVERGDGSYDSTDLFLYIRQLI